MEQELRRHNEMVLRTLEKGDLLQFDRGVFSYWGVYIGDGTIVYLAGVDVAGTAVDSSMSNVSTISETGYRKACVKRDNFWDVAGNSRVIKNNNKDRITLPYPRRDIKERALSRLGPASYSVLWENCEHFAGWCRYGIALSDQLSSEIIELDVIRHNQTVIGTLKDGDLVEFDRGIYSHWGVYIGDETIVHLTGLYVAGTAVYSSMSNLLTLSASRSIEACVKREKFWEVAGSSRMKKNNNKDRITLPYPGRDIKERALSRLGPASYSVLGKNCEHFASCCRYGRDLSDQAEAAEAAMTWVGGFILGASLTGVGAFVYAERSDRNYRRRYPRRDIKDRALSRLGIASCSDLLDNSEQFEIAVSDQADAAMIWVGGFVLGASLTGVGVFVYSARTDGNDSRMESKVYCSLTSVCSSNSIMWDNFEPFAVGTRNGIHASGRYRIDLGCRIGTCATMNWLN